MRRLVLTATFATLAACSAPTGAPQTWPPPLGTFHVAAVASGDVDGDGIPDLVVASTGTAAGGGGVYLVSGASDLALATSSPIASFSAVRPLAITAPAALVVASISGRPTVVLARSVGGKVQLTALSGGDLAIAGEHATAQTVGMQLSLRVVTFPGNLAQLMIVTDDDVEHARVEDLPTSATPDERPIPSPSMATPWAMPQLVTTFSTGGADSVSVAVATPTTLQTSPLPTAGAMQFTWTTVRTGAAWTAQTAFDLDGNGRDEIVGLQGSQLCAADPGTAMAPRCLPITASVADTMLVANLTNDTRPDLVLVHGSVTIIPNLVLTAAALTADAALTPTPGAGPFVAVLAIPGAPPAVLSLGPDGTTACVAAGPVPTCR